MLPLVYSTRQTDSHMHYVEDDKLSALHIGIVVGQSGELCFNREFGDRSIAESEQLRLVLIGQ